MRISEVFGFNYDGSWGSSGLDLWQHHDHGRMAIEVARGKNFFPRWNTARWWLSMDAFQRDPDRFSANLDAGLEIFARHEVRVIPLLFNRWLDPVCDFGGVPLDHLIPHHSAWNRSDDLFADVAAEGRDRSPLEEVHHRYLTTVIGRHRDDERILAWDLCNEPLMGRYVADETSPARAAELTWLGWLRDVCRATGASQPLTIGNYPDLTAIRLTEPLSDFVSFHPYHTWNLDPDQHPMATRSGFEAHLDAVVDLSRTTGKELLASETVWGARDDARHVEVMRYTLGRLRERGIGFTVHALHHSLVSDLHRDAWGPVGPPECLHFIEADGSLREGHEIFNEFAPDRSDLGDDLRGGGRPPS